MCATAGCNRPSDRYHKHLRGRLCVRACSYHYRIEPSSELECEHCAEATPLVTVETAGGGVRLCARCEPLKQVRALLPTSVHLRVSLCTIVSHAPCYRLRLTLQFTTEQALRKPRKSLEAVESSESSAEEDAPPSRVRTLV